MVAFFLPEPGILFLLFFSSLLLLLLFASSPKLPHLHPISSSTVRPYADGASLHLISPKINSTTNSKSYQNNPSVHHNISKTTAKPISPSPSILQPDPFPNPYSSIATCNPSKHSKANLPSFPNPHKAFISTSQIHSMLASAPYSSRAPPSPLPEPRSSSRSSKPAHLLHRQAPSRRSFSSAPSHRYRPSGFSTAGRTKPPPSLMAATTSFLGFNTSRSTPPGAQIRRPPFLISSQLSTGAAAPRPCRQAGASPSSPPSPRFLSLSGAPSLLSHRQTNPLPPLRPDRLLHSKQPPWHCSQLAESTSSVAQ